MFPLVIFGYAFGELEISSQLLIFMISIALGNLLTAIITQLVPKSLGTGTALYFYFYAGLMFATALLFFFILKSYKETTYLQEEEDRIISESNF